MEFKKKVSEISKKVGKTATETYNTVADKSGKFIEDTKLRISISDKEADIEKIFEGIGKSVYEEYKAGKDVGKEFTKECKNVDKMHKEIDEMNKTILYNKGLRTCEKCGEIISTEATFCAVCGSKQKPVKLKSESKKEKEEEELKEKNKEKVCPQCGIVCAAGSKFCTKCGYQLEK